MTVDLITPKATHLPILTISQGETLVMLSFSIKGIHTAADSSQGRNVGSHIVLSFNSHTKSEDGQDFMQGQISCL